MNKNSSNSIDFENPSLMFRFEDKLKSVLGGPLHFNSFIKSFELKGDEKVLDFGCGGGTGSKCLIKFLNNNGHLTCVDTSKYWIKKAKNRLEKYPNVDCMQGDIRELNIPDSSIDVIFINYVIHDIVVSERQDTIKALSRKLNKNGRMFLREPIKDSHGIPVKDLIQLLSNAGLKEADSRKSKSEFKGEFHRMK